MYERASENGMSEEKINSVDIVIPIYNEEGNIELMMKRLRSMSENHKDICFKYIFINDGSSDNSLSLLKKFAKSDKAVQVVNFSRNFGHQAAVTAGIDLSTADAVVLIDADLQDPPELISTMITELESGYDVIYAQRISRKGETWHKRLSAKCFYYIFDKLTSITIPRDTGDFRIMRRNVVEEVKSMKERHRFIRGMVAWCGFRTKPLKYHRDARHAGDTGYPYRKMIAFSLNAIFSFSSAPIKFVNYMGLFSVILSFLGLMRLVILWLVYEEYDRYEAGLIATLIAVLFMGGVQLMSLGILGEYIGKIFEQQKERPIYIVSDKLNFIENDTTKND